MNYDGKSRMSNVGRGQGIDKCVSFWWIALLLKEIHGRGIIFPIKIKKMIYWHFIINFVTKYMISSGNTGQLICLNTLRKYSFKIANRSVYFL